MQEKNIGKGAVITVYTRYIYPYSLGASTINLGRVIFWLVELDPLPGRSLDVNTIKIRFSLGHVMYNT